MIEDGAERKFHFLRNGDPDPSELDWNKGIESARQAISEAMGAKNIAFLLGAGCSLVLSRIYAAPITRLGCLAFEGQGAFASQR